MFMNGVWKSQSEIKHQDASNFIFFIVFIFTLLFGASKGFMKAFKAFIKPFETPQGSVKMKI